MYRIITPTGETFLTEKVIPGTALLIVGGLGAGNKAHNKC